MPLDDSGICSIDDVDCSLLFSSMLHKVRNQSIVDYQTHRGIQEALGVSFWVLPSQSSAFVQPT